MTDQIYRELKFGIQTNLLKPGEPVREADVCGRFEVSRTPVREALQRLQREGLIESNDGGGFAVATFSRNDIEEIYQLRLILEVEAVSLACKNPDKALRLDAIAASIQKSHEGVRQGDAQLFIEANREFRIAWLGLVPNGRLVRTVRLYAGHVYALQSSTLMSPARQKRVLAGMEEIEAAIRSGDAQASRKAMKKYLATAHAAMLELVEFSETLQNE